MYRVKVWDSKWGYSRVRELLAARFGLQSKDTTLDGTSGVVRQLERYYSSLLQNQTQIMHLFGLWIGLNQSQTKTPTNTCDMECK